MWACGYVDKRRRGLGPGGKVKLAQEGEHPREASLCILYPSTRPQTHKSPYFIGIVLVSQHRVTFSRIFYAYVRVNLSLHDKGNYKNMDELPKNPQMPKVILKNALLETVQYENKNRESHGDSRKGHATGNHKTNFHAVTFRPKNGVTAEQVKLMKDQFAKDTSADGVARTGTFGIELVGEKRHAHIALILKKPQRHGHTTQKRYQELLRGTYDQTLTAENNKGALNIWQPGKKRRENNFSAFTFLAYPLKYLALGENDESIIPNLDAKGDGTKWLSSGFWDGMEGEQLSEAKATFAARMKFHIDKKMAGQRTKFIDGSERFYQVVMPEFVRQVCPELEITLANEPEIISRMFVYANRHVKYKLTERFLLGQKSRYTFRTLNRLTDPAERKQACLEAVKHTYAIMAKNTGKIYTVKALNTEVKTLKEENAELKNENAAKDNTIAELHKEIETRKKTEKVMDATWARQSGEINALAKEVKSLKEKDVLSQRAIESLRYKIKDNKRRAQQATNPQPAKKLRYAAPGTFDFRNM